jgi:hypothetical protein
MDTATHILVVILSVFLALFLLLGIIVAVQVIRLLKVVSHIAHKAEAVIDSAESVGTIFKNAAGPLALVRVLRNMAHVVQGNKRGKK